MTAVDGERQMEDAAEAMASPSRGQAGRFPARRLPSHLRRQAPCHVISSIVWSNVPKDRGSALIPAISQTTFVPPRTFVKLVPAITPASLCYKASPYSTVWVDGAA